MGYFELPCAIGTDWLKWKKKVWSLSRDDVQVYLKSQGNSTEIMKAQKSQSVLSYWLLFLLLIISDRLTVNVT